MAQRLDQCLSKWIDRKAITETMIPLVGQLHRNNNVVTSIHGRDLVSRSAIAIMKAHRFTRHRMAGDAELSVHEALPVLKAVSGLKLGAASVDLGKMIAKFKTEGSGRSIEDFVKVELTKVADKQSDGAREGTDVVLYGFGHIGCPLARILIERTGGGDSLRLRAIVMRKGAENDLVKRASLLHRGLVYGPFDGTITVDEESDTLIANGNLIQVIYPNDPASIGYTQHGIKNALLADNTGKRRDAEGLDQHLKCPGVDHVAFTAPGKDALKNIMHGINHTDIDADDRIISAASYTANAIVLMLKAANDQHGIISGHVETAHSYTSDQNLTDNFHKGSRRGRSTPLNMVITETGAATAAAETLPMSKGKLIGSAIRVPTLNVSTTILSLNLERATTREEINECLRQMAIHSNLQEQISFVSSQEVVSTDFVSSHHADVVDTKATICDDNRVVLCVWYDNEFSYGCQVMRVMEDMAEVGPPAFPC